MLVLALLQLQEVGSHKKLIPDFLTWMQCFAIYTTVLGVPLFQLLFAEVFSAVPWGSWR